MALLPILLLFAVMYVLVIRPQQRRLRMHQAFVASLGLGEEVVTTGGIFGTITALDDDVASLEIAPGVTVRVLRSAINRRLVEEDEVEEPYDDEAVTGEAADLDSELAQLQESTNAPPPASTPAPEPSAAEPEPPVTPPAPSPPSHPTHPSQGPPESAPPEEQR